MKSKLIAVLCVGLLMLTGCSSYKNVPYLQNPEVVNEMLDTLPMYDLSLCMMQKSCRRIC